MTNDCDLPFVRGKVIRTHILYMITAILSASHLKIEQRDISYLIQSGKFHMVYK